MKTFGVWLVVCATGAFGQAGKAMAKDAHPAYEVETVKLTPLADRNQGFHSDENRLEIENETVKSMLMFAYGLHGKQLVGEPAWVDDTSYDIKGVLDTPGEPSLAQMQEVVQKVLAERFGLKVRRDKRDLNYFALRPAGTLKIAKSVQVDGQPDQSGNGNAKGQMMKYTYNTMDEFIIGLNYFTDRPVVNETGLPGRWDFEMRWLPDGRREGDIPADAYPNLFTAMREQLGLKLEAAKGPVDVLVVDAVARPSDN